MATNLKRRDKHNYYLDIAESVMERSTCMRRTYGAIIVNEDEIVSTGYAGAPRQRHNCIDLGFCRRDFMNVPRGQRYELCRSVHAEANCIISASRREMKDGALYLVGKDARTGQLLDDAMCCSMCQRLIINAGLAKVFVRRTNEQFVVIDVNDWINNDDTVDA